MLLQDSVCVVTGGASGLGAALVDGVVERGGIPLLIDLNEQRLSEALSSLEKRGVKAAGWAGDIADRARVRAIFGDIAARFGRVDLMVNCAGRSMLVPFMDMTDEEIDWVTGPNMLGVVHCTRAAVPLMRAGSRIVNITSVSGRVPTPGEAYYSAMKAAVVSLSDSLRIELQSHGIGITVVLPGEMSTNLFAEHASWELRPDFQRKMEMPPALMARAIFKGIERGQDEVVSPWSMSAALLFQQFAPRLFMKGVDLFYYRKLHGRIRRSAGK